MLANESNDFSVGWRSNVHFGYRQFTAARCGFLLSELILSGLMMQPRIVSSSLFHLLNRALRSFRRHAGMGCQQRRSGRCDHHWIVRSTTTSRRTTMRRWVVLKRPFFLLFFIWYGWVFISNIVLTSLWLLHGSKNILAAFNLSEPRNIDSKV